ncbi:unnamed protein product [Toxocara canis]|nr:unnamed protein product [Toxocara canis]
MKCDHDTAVSFLIPIEYKRERHSPDELVLSSPSRFPEGSTSTEKETISKEDSSGCSVPPVPNNSTKESTSHLLSLSECATDSDTDDNNFTSAEVRLETAEIPSCWKHLLPESSPSQPNATCELAHEPSSSDGSRKASDKQLYAKSQGQHIDATQLSRRVSGYSNSGEWRSLQTTSTTSNVRD